MCSVLSISFAFLSSRNAIPWTNLACGTYNFAGHKHKFLSADMLTPTVAEKSVVKFYDGPKPSLAIEV
jgi:hypothetical protein